MTTITQGLVRVCEWVMRFSYLNLLWLFFSIIGLFIFGFFPATTAMFSVVRRWCMDEPDIPIFQTFWYSYRTEFIKSNVLGIILVVLGFILYIDFTYIKVSDSFFSSIMGVVLMGLSIFYLVILLYIFPVFVHYQLRTFQYFKYAINIGILYPIKTLFMIVISFVLFAILTTMPGLMLFFLGSTISFVLMWTSYNVFKSIEKRSHKKPAEESKAI